jgi:hypothetical protein
MSEGGGAAQQVRWRVLERIASVGASAQAAIPGLYAWAVTVAPAAWARGAPRIAQVAAALGLLALVSAPLVEVVSPAGEGTPGSAPTDGTPAQRAVAAVRRARRPTWARILSVWGFVLASCVVWAAAPAALSSTRFDGVRGALGMIGWALFAFASAGPVLRRDPALAGRAVAGASLEPRSALPRGDGAYVVVGVTLALVMQGIGWDVVAPERAVLVRLVTVVCGAAVIGGATGLALARHARRARASRRARTRRALPWIAMLVLFAASGLLVGLGR